MATKLRRMVKHAGRQKARRRSMQHGSKRHQRERGEERTEPTQQCPRLCGAVSGEEMSPQMHGDPETAQGEVEVHRNLGASWAQWGYAVGLWMMLGLWCWLWGGSQRKIANEEVDEKKVVDEDEDDGMFYDRGLLEDSMEVDLCTAEAEELLSTEVPERYGLEPGPEVTLDSGDSASVANAAKHFPGAKVVPSEASRRGVVYRGPRKDRIPNEGEFQEQIMTAEGAVANTLWQSADVRKPLMAVSSCEDRGNMCVFDQEGSCILSANCPELPQIRRLIQQATKKVKVHRAGGTYSLKTWRMPPKNEGFRGLGKR